MANYTTNIIDENDVSENPALTSMIVTQLNERLLSDELDASIKEQYIEFNNLGYNFINDYSIDVLTPELLIDMIEFIDNNFIGVEFLGQINDHDRNTYIFGPMLYEILFVDMIKFILPNLMKKLETRDPNDIKYLDPPDLRFKLIEVVKDILEGLQKTREFGDGKNQKIAREIVKYSFCLDLFDADLEDFLENYIIPVINNYNTIISSADV
ncbi:MAG: hypothetical protein H8D97_01690 [Proteobacteria bacterium]|nr:hypothetical protein [Pseudomonadota bacterium]